MSSKLKIGTTISADTDNFVRYCKYDKRFAVVKGLFTGLDDALELYERELEFQTLLTEKGFAPKLLAKDIEGDKKGRMFVLWVSEDAGLPIEDQDIPAANMLLDELYDMGIILHWAPSKHLFVKGFDGKIRVTDFKQTEKHASPVTKDNRKYI